MSATVHVNSLWPVAIVFTALFAIAWGLVAIFGILAIVVILRLKEAAPSIVETQPAMPRETL